MRPGAWGRAGTGTGELLKWPRPGWGLNNSGKERQRGPAGVMGRGGRGTEGRGDLGEDARPRTAQEPRGARAGRALAAGAGGGSRGWWASFERRREGMGSAGGCASPTRRSGAARWRCRGAEKRCRGRGGFLLASPCSKRRTRYLWRAGRPWVANEHAEWGGVGPGWPGPEGRGTLGGGWGVAGGRSWK